MLLNTEAPKHSTSQNIQPNNDLDDFNQFFPYNLNPPKASNS